MESAADLSMVFPADTATVRDCLEAIDRGANSIALAVDGSGRLVGLVTDGDMRRALLAGADLKTPAAAYIRTNPVSVDPGYSRSAVLDLMSSLRISQVPIVSADGTLVGLHLLRGLVGRSPRSNTAVILAGGQGQRLRPLTEEVPKPMLRVAGRPILERVVTHLVGFGIKSIVLAVGYRADVIERHFGDGADFGCSISYLREDPASPRGTAGPLADLGSIGLTAQDPLLVVNGDLVTQFDVAALLDHHLETQAQMTVGVTTYRHFVPYGVVQMTDQGVVTRITEKPEWREFVNAGIYVVDPLITEFIDRERLFPMTELIETSIARGNRVVGWLCDQDWIDVGVPQDLAKAQGLSR